MLGFRAKSQYLRISRGPIWAFARCAPLPGRSGRVGSRGPAESAIECQPSSPAPHQHEAGRKTRRRGGPGDRNVTVFPGLTHDFEHTSQEFRQFIEEQHSVVHQRHFARPRNNSSPISPASENRVMTERKGRVPTRPEDAFRTPATLWIFVVSKASSKVAAAGWSSCAWRASSCPTRRPNHQQVVRRRRQPRWRAWPIVNPARL